MRRLFSIFLALTLLTCGLVSLRGLRCMEASGENGVRPECVARKECSAAQKGCAVTRSSQDDCNVPQPNDPAPCCFICSPNCCYYLLPTVGFQLRSFSEATIEKPHGLQHRYAQAFHRSVWHPPATKV